MSEPRRHGEFPEFASLPHELAIEAARQGFAFSHVAIENLFAFIGYVTPVIDRLLTPADQAPALAGDVAHLSSLARSYADKLAEHKLAYDGIMDQLVTAVRGCDQAGGTPRYRATARRPNGSRCFPRPASSTRATAARSRSIPPP